MNSDENNQISPDKERKPEEKKQEEEKNSINYFKIMKEIEKEQKGKDRESQTKNSNKLEAFNLTEKIYAKNSEKLGNYYKNNKNNLLLYGSKKYDLLTIQKLVKEMSKYKSKILKKINENKKIVNKAKDYNFESSDEKVILTPLALSDKKNKNISDSLEKKKFEEAQRSGVIMRRIEYVNLLENRDSFKRVDDSEQDKKIFLLIKEAVDKIERNWLLHKWRKQKEKENDENINKDESEDNKNIKLRAYNDKIKRQINFKIEHFYLQLLKKKNKLNNNSDKINNNLRIINKSNNRCFIKKLLDISSSKEKQKHKENIEELETKLNESNKNYLKIKSLLDKANLENKKLKEKLNNEISNNQKESEKLLKTNKEINDKLKKVKTEYDDLKQKNNSLMESFNQVVDDNNKTKKDLDEAAINNKLLLEKISNLNSTMNTIDTENEKKNNELQTVIDLITNEKDKKDEELGKVKLDLEQNLNKVNSYENEINNLKLQIQEQNKINETNLEKNNKDLEEYKHKISSLEKEKEEMQNSIQELEEISNSYKDKYTKLCFQNKNDINKFNNEKNELKNEISGLKKELANTKKIQEKEISDVLNKINDKEKYENKINNLNKIIEELRKRIKNIYFQLSLLQNSEKFNKTADVVVRLKLMLLLTRNYLDKNIIFDKREFFNILMKKYKKKFFSRIKRIEYLRDNVPNDFPY